MNYNPHLTHLGKMAMQAVQLTFGIWGYRAKMRVEVGGNCTGLAVIDCAVNIAYRQLEKRPIRLSDCTYAVIKMIDLASPHPILECCEDDGGDRLRGEGWLKDMLIGAEITSIAVSRKATQ